VDTNQTTDLATTAEVLDTSAETAPSPEVEEDRTVVTAQADRDPATIAAKSVISPEIAPLAAAAAVTLEAIKLLKRCTRVIFPICVQTR